MVKMFRSINLFKWDKTKMNIKELGHVSVEEIHLAQGTIY
jgi:hypothetical protein